MLEILAAEERGTPLSPARLSERIGLTFGATSTLLNRLEAAGHVARSRVHTDRRIVSLHSTQGVHQLAGDFFGPLGQRLAHVMQAYPPEVLDQFESLLRELRDSMEGYIEERADGVTSTEPTAPSPTAPFSTGRMTGWVDGSGRARSRSGSDAGARGAPAAPTEALPDRDEVVIIGGGIMGTSIAFHLAEAGVRDVLVIERDSLGSGSSAKPLGGVRATFSDANNVLLGQRSLAAFETFEARFGTAIGLRQVGLSVPVPHRGRAGGGRGQRPAAEHARLRQPHDQPGARRTRSIRSCEPSSPARRVVLAPGRLRRAGSGGRRLRGRSRDAWG